MEIKLLQILRFESSLTLTKETGWIPRNESQVANWEFQNSDNLHHPTCKFPRTF